MIKKVLLSGLLVSSMASALDNPFNKEKVKNFLNNIDSYINRHMLENKNVENFAFGLYKGAKLGAMNRALEHVIDHNIDDKEPAQALKIVAWTITYTDMRHEQYKSNVIDALRNSQDQLSFNSADYLARKKQLSRPEVIGRAIGQTLVEGISFDKNYEPQFEIRWNLNQFEATYRVAGPVATAGLGLLFCANLFI